MIFLTFSLMLASTGLVMTTGTSWRVLAWALFGLTVAARCGLFIVHRLRFGRPLLQDFFLVPLRDLLTCGIWCQTFFCRRMTWRGYEFVVDSTGLMRRVA